MLTFDHIAIGASDLATGTAWVEAQLGVTLHPGGQHARYGTHNTLLGLGDLYLEVIALDPTATRRRPAWFALDAFIGPPRLVNWICRTDDITSAPRVCGPAQSLTRGDLHWRITVPDDGSMPDDGAHPTLIQWGDGTPHPASRLPDSGCRLTGWHISHPDADRLRDTVPITDERITFTKGPKGFRATFDTPHGPRTL